MTQTTERVESKKVEKILTFVKIMIVIVILIPLIIVLKNYEHVSSLRLSHFSQFFLALFLLFRFYTKFSKRKGQFIEWSPNEIQFKTKEQEGEIPINEIKNIDINIDSIDITLENGENYMLNIQDFGDYDTRIKIKDNFSKLQTLPV
jgi:hypothetical protein